MNLAEYREDRTDTHIAGVGRVTDPPFEAQTSVHLSAPVIRRWLQQFRQATVATQIAEEETRMFSEELASFKGVEADLFLSPFDDRAGDFLIPTKKSTTEEIIRDIGRLSPNWAGPGTVSPTQNTIDDLERVAGCLPSNFKRPSVEVDEDEGHITLAWISADQNRMFSLLFKGDSFVIGSYSSLNRGESERPWKYKVAEEAKITDATDVEKVRQLILA